MFGILNIEGICKRLNKRKLRYIQQGFDSCIHGNLKLNHTFDIQKNGLYFMREKLFGTLLIIALLFSCSAPRSISIKENVNPDSEGTKTKQATTISLQDEGDRRYPGFYVNVGKVDTVHFFKIRILDTGEELGTIAPESIMTMKLFNGDLIDVKSVDWTESKLQGVSGGIQQWETIVIYHIPRSVIDQILASPIIYMRARASKRYAYRPIKLYHYEKLKEALERVLYQGSGMPSMDAFQQ